MHSKELTIRSSKTLEAVRRAESSGQAGRVPTPGAPRVKQGQHCRGDTCASKPEEAGPVREYVDLTVCARPHKEYSQCGSLSDQ